MAKNIEHENLIDVLKGDARQVDFTQMIKEQQEFVRKAQSLAGSKSSKVEEAYIAEQKTKLSELEDIVKRWVWQAFPEDDEVVNKTMSWGQLCNNFEVQVMIKKIK
jgi:hypothetical protein